MRYPIFAAAVLWPMILHSAELTLPKEVTGDPAAFITIPATTDGEVVKWRVIDPGLNLFPVNLLRDTKTAVVSAGKPGRYRVLAVSATEGEPSDIEMTTVFVGKPEPVPPPDPEPDPTPDPDVTDAPFPCDGLHVLMVFESADASKLTPDQLAILYSAEIRAFTNRATNGNLRIYDRDQTPTDEPWKSAMAVPSDGLPYLLVSNGKTGFSGPLTMTPEEFKSIISQHAEK